MPNLETIKILILLLEGDAVDGELLHRGLTDAHVCDHGLHLGSLALQQHIQAAAAGKCMNAVLAFVPKLVKHSNKQKMCNHLYLVVNIYYFLLNGMTFHFAQSKNKQTAAYF